MTQIIQIQILDKEKLLDLDLHKMKLVHNRDT
jgi:hypothetical protein